MTDLSPRLAALSAEQRAQLARLLRERAQREQTAMIPRRAPQTDTAPCSWMQRGLWLLDQLQPGPAYNLVTSTRLRGRLDVAVLERALNEVIRRHEVLRTTFHAEDGEPAQRIAPELYVPITVVDLSALPAEVRDAEARRRATHEAQQPFDLAQGPLLRPTLLQFSDSDWRIILVVHHIISDAWGMGLLANEVQVLYRAFIDGQPSPLPELPIQYADYAVWQRTTHSQEAIERDLEYWRTQLANAPSTELPTDKLRPSTRRFHGSRLQFRFPATLVEQLTALGRREGTTLYMVLLAAFQTLLHRYTGQDDIVVGSPIVDRGHAETHGLIGFFLNTLMMRADLSGDPTFRELLQRVRRVALEAYEHQSAPFDQIVKTLQPTRDASRSPLFQIMFTFHDALPEAAIPAGFQPESEDVEPGTTQLDLTLMLQQAGDSVTGIAEFDTDLFEQGTIERLVEHLGVLLAGIVADPERRLSELPLLTAAERRLVVEDWNQTARPYPSDETLPSLFAQQVARAPEAVAVVSEEERLTYRELDARANRLAHYLRGLGIGPETLVGVYLDRSPDLVVALLAILKAGGAYVPLDPAYPPERLRLMAEDADLAALVSRSGLLERLPAGARVVCVDTDAARIAAQPPTDPPPLGTAADLAYVIYTSGSTGRPKGVMLPHSAVVNTLLWLQEAFPLTAADTVAQKTASSFTDSVWELFWPLLVGSKLAILRDEVVRDPGLLYRALADQRVTVTQFVPPQLSAFLEWLAAVDVDDPLPALRWIFNGGEALPPQLAQAWYARFRQARIANIYGMTESAIYGTCAIVEPASDGGEPRVLVGRPIANATAYVLDRWGQPCPPGVPGEIHLGGRGLARGYLGRPDLTAERFVPDPFSADPAARLYKTGDLGRYLPDGSIDYLGRLDDQVKIRGFRVEPAEIEATLRAHPAIHDAAVVTREHRPGHKRLVAYVVPTGGALPSTEELAAHLRQRLPEYMVPAVYMALDALPQTPSGKVDRRALPEPDTDRADGGAEYVAPRTPAEEMLAGIWAEILGLERIGIRDNFFALGGDSILSMRVVARARACGLEVSPSLLFQHQTIGELAPVIEAASPAEPSQEVTDPSIDLDGRIEQILAQLGEGTGVPLGQDDLEDVYPLGPLQQGLLYHSLAAPDTTVYVEQLAWSFKRTLDLDAYRQAWQGAVDRHPILRTGFIWHGLDAPVQAVLRRATLRFQNEDWRGLDETEQQAQLDRRRDEERRKGFDLAAVPLMRLVVARLRDDAWTCVWTFHHLLLDGWSVSLLLADVFARYRAVCAARAPELPAVAPYRDFITWLQRQDPGQAERYWRTALRGLTAPTTLPIGTAALEPIGSTSEPGEHLASIAEATVEALQAVARRERLTLNTLVQGAWALLLSRYSGDEDVVFGATTSVRPLDVPGIEGTLGLMINTLPVRVQVPPEATLVPWLRALQAEQAKARSYAYSPLTDIQGWSDIPRGEPLFESLLIFENFPLDAVRQETANLDLLIDDGRYATHSTLPLNLMVHPGSQLALRFLYDPGRFDGATVERLAEHLGVLLAGIAADPERRLSELPLLPEAERRLVVETWNQTATPLPADATIAGLFAEQVARTPEAVALVDGEQQLTYRALDARATQLAHQLRGLGVGPGQLVGVCLERTAELVVALLGVLQAGGAYVPLDPGYPTERLAYMLADSGARVLVTGGAVAARVPAGTARVVRVDAEAGVIAQQPRAALPSLATGEDLAYVLYTSGSTGRPKGVQVAHRNVVGFFVGMDGVLGSAAPGVWLAVTSVSFDISVLELLWTLCRGFRVVLQPELRALAEAGAERTVARAVAEQGVTHLQCTPSLARLVAEEAGGLAALRGVRYLLLGGEALPAELARRLVGAGEGADEGAGEGEGGGPTLLNLYGPTETTVWSTVHRVVPPLDGAVPIGRPLANTRVYVLDPYGQPTPIGVPGELYIGGVGVARGYLGRAELTAERFVADPFSAAAEARLYRTGDLVRWRADGALEFLGRLDQQVKLRGYRIEPGEIEATLRAHPRVAEAAVVVREERAGDPRLVAYLVGAEGEAVPGTEALRAYLGERLPEYMVPSAFVVLDALPLTPNGKLDRRALPAPADGTAAAADGYVAPRTPIEAVVAGVWATVLGVEQVGVSDDFFMLGGHSLLATRVLARVRQALGVDLPLRVLVEGRTVEALARAIDAARAQDAGRDEVPLVRTSRDEPLPVSFAQQRLWFLDRLEGGSPRYNIPGAVRLRGRLDPVVLERALQALVDRHEALRTTFDERDGEPVQVIAPVLNLVPTWHDLRSLPAAEQAAELARRLDAEALRPFNLVTGPLIRAGVLRLADDEHVLTLTLHHIIADGWSLGVLWHDLAELYAAAVQGSAPDLPMLALQYADYAMWQRAWLDGPRLERQLAYWRKKLAGAPTRLDLPTDRPRPAIQDYCGAGVPVRLGSDLVRALRRLGVEHHATLYMVLLAAFQTLLHRYTGQDDLLVGTPTAGRSQLELEDLVGLFVNTLVLRGDLTGDPTFVELLARTRETALDADAHQDLPFERLVTELQLERDLSVNPLVQVLFVMQNLPHQASGLAGLTVEPVELQVTTAKVDLALVLHETPDGLEGGLEYDTALFAAATVERLAEHLGVLLAGIAADPERRLSELPLLPEAERRLVVETWNQTATPLPADATIAGLFAEQVARTPEAVALVDGEQQLTYRALDARATQLAHQLRGLGVGPGQLVGVCLERTAELVVALLGVLQAGGAYVPLDPGYPTERLAYMLADSGARVLVSAGAVAARVPAGTARVVRVDAEAGVIAQQPRAALPLLATGEDLAYVLYTSGSTGRPKGVQVAHRNVVGFFVGMDGVLGSAAPGVWLAVTSVSFDISVLELLWTLCRGFRVVLQPELRALAEAGAERTVARAVAEQGVTHLQCTPSLARLVAEEAGGLAALRGVRYLLLGGEALPAELARRLVGDGEGDGSGPTLVNMYGPTETTVWSTVHRVVPPVTGPVPIGRPLANTRVYVLDPYGQPTPIGVPGELYIGGVGVARGYLGRAELTAERFVADPFSAAAEARLYRTGDLVRWRADGVLEFLGRLDQQVKLRGYRIEPGEIEATLRAHPRVAEAAVVVREERAGDPRLVAYLVGAEGEAVPGTEALRAYLGERLPEYMVPSAFVVLDALPLTPNGKLDRRALPAPADGTAAAADGYVAPETVTEALVAEIWAEVLGVERVGVSDNFFDLGGHSLLLLRVHHRLRQALEQELRVVDLFRYPTVRALARHLAGETETDAGRAATIGESPRAARQRAALRWGGQAEATAEAQSESDRAATPGGLVVRAEAIAIVGMAGRFPGAASVDEFWANVRDGVESIRTFSDAELLAAGVDPRVVANPAYIKAHGALDDVRGFDAGFFKLSAHEADLLDPQQRLFLECAWEALEHAGYAPNDGLGPVGVYAGVGPSAYQIALFAAPSVRDQLDGFQVQLTNDKDYVATRVAYKLNLRGPAVTVQTACSTSLVAVVLACQALLTHQCDIALAGGCSVQVPDKGGYVHLEGGTLSADGHCRPFDAEATGMVPGQRGWSGGAEAAERGRGGWRHDLRGDSRGRAQQRRGRQGRVHGAERRGAGGGDRHRAGAGRGLPRRDHLRRGPWDRHPPGGPDRGGGADGRVPAGDGADGVLRAGVGEVERRAPGYGGRGDRAAQDGAGAAAPRAAADPARRAAEPPAGAGDKPVLPEHGAPRLARRVDASAGGGGSSGLGGTNAHVVLEEAPPVAREPGAARPAQLLLMSAATPTALEQATTNLAAYLTAHPAVALADVAYTLQVGRAQLPYRRAIVARSPAAGAAVLTSGDPRRMATAAAAERAPAVAFLLPGQGAQHVGMARELYGQAPVYRAALDRCCAVLERHLGRDLRALLVAPDGDAEAAAALRQTALAQPALFAVEYALAQWWRAQGVAPQALLGHSLGEYVAACLAGVFTLEDALGLVAARGRLMQALPRGAMLAVPLGEEALTPYLGAELALAAVNGPALCVASGPSPAIDALEAQLGRDGIVVTRLHTSHAFHSGMQDPILGPFAEQVARVPRAVPSLPFVSNVTGTWITAEQATSPEYWAEHLRATVRFGDGLGTLLAEPARLLLEVGPGQTLTRLATGHPARQAAQGAVATLPHPTERQGDLDAALLAVGRLWAAGVPLEPTGLWPEGGRRIALPTYPFEHQDHWIELRPGLDVAGSLPAAPSPALDPTDWVYEPVWRPSSLAARAATPSDDSAAAAHWLIFLDRAGLGEGLAARLRAEGRTVATVVAGERFVQVGEEAYAIAPGCRDDYAALLADLQGRGVVPTAIVHGWSVTPDLPSRDEAARLGPILDQGFHSLTFLAQALDALAGRPPVRITVLTNHVQAVTGEEPLSPEKATVLGPCLVIPQEHPDLDVRSVDMALPPAGSARQARLLDRLRDELTASPHDGPVAYRGGRRWVRTFERVPRASGGERAVPLREGGVYLITGGLGGIGLILAEHLAATVQARLVLLGRSAVPAREEWAAWLAAHGDDDTTSRRIRRLQAIEARGGQVLALAADVADLAQMRSVLDQTLARFERLDGVIHAAGAMTADAFRAVVDMRPADAERQWRPKLRGARVLEAVLAGRDLDFCLLFSSLSAILGGLGFGAYAAANAFLDAVAHERALTGDGRWISVNWDAWRTSESAPTAEVGGRAGDLGATTIDPADGAELFERVLSLGDLPQVVVATGDLRGRFERWVGRVAPTTRTAGTEDAPSVSGSVLERHARPNLATPFVAPSVPAEVALAGIWADVLGLDLVGIDDNFFDLGGDSILGIQVVARARQVGLELRPAHLFEHQTIAELAQVVTVAAPPEPAVEADDAPLIDLGQQQLELILAQTDRAARPS